jgi:hypothetical protein
MPTGQDRSDGLFQPKLAKLKHQPMRFIVDCRSAKALMNLGSPLVRCFGLQKFYNDHMQCRYGRPQQYQHPQAIVEQEKDWQSLSVVAKAFIERCAKAHSQFQSATLSAERPFDVEFTLTDIRRSKPGKTRVLLDSFLGLCFPADIVIGVMYRGPRMVAHNVTRDFLLNADDGRSFTRLIDGPSAEEWKENWEKDEGSPGDV